MNISTAIRMGLLAGAISVSSLSAEEFYWDFGIAQTTGSKVLVPNELNELRALSDAGYTVDKDGDRKVLAMSGSQPEALRTIKKMPALSNAVFKIEVKPSSSPEVSLIRNGSAWSLRYAETRGFILIVWTQETGDDGKIPYVQVSLPATTETWHKVVCEITETSASITPILIIVPVKFGVICLIPIICAEKIAQN